MTTINDTIGSDAKGKDLVGTGIRQTWRQWCNCCRGAVRPERFEEPWASLWREGLTAAEATQRVLEAEGGQAEPDWMDASTNYVIERTNASRILTCLELFEHLEWRHGRGWSHMEDIKPQCRTSVQAAVERMLSLHQERPSPRFREFLNQAESFLREISPKLVAPGPTPSKESAMPRKPKTPSAPSTISIGEQLELIDVKHPAHKKISALVRRIRECDADRSEAQEASTRAREDLGEVLHEHNLREFRIGEHIVKIRPGKEKVSVRKAETEGGDEE
jgi:hypothetical protein